jgi:hypothetical protein
MPESDIIITSPFLQLIKAELAPLASQLHEQYTVDYVAGHMFEALGEELLARVTDKERKQLQKDWLARFDFFKTVVPIPDDIAERCFGADAKSPLTSRGEAIKIYGEEAVMAEAKKRGFSSLTALKPISGPSKSATKNAPEVRDSATNPWSDKMAFKSPAERQAKQIEIIRVSTKLAANLARAAGMQVNGQPLRSR